MTTPTFDDPEVDAWFKRQLMRAKRWASVGGFDEQFAGYGADLDWCWRARSHHLLFGVTDKWAVVHQGGVTAVSQGLAGITHDTAGMDAALVAKWGRHWWEMASGQ